MTLPPDLKQKCLVLYVGTRKLVALLADLRESQPRVLHKEEVLFPDGFEKGYVCNLQNAALSLEKIMGAILPPEAWEHVSVYVVLGNSGFKFYRFSSCEYYTPDKRTISSHEVQSVVQQTRSVATLPLSESILQAVPESFLVNDMAAVRNPVGLEAERLGVTLQLYTMDFQNFRNIVKAFEAIDVDVCGYFPKALTVAESVLTDAEKQEGVLIIDIGDDAAQLVLWKNGYLAGIRSLSAGGSELTRCIARDYHIEERDADKVKFQFATLDESERVSEELVPLVTRNEKVQQSVHRKEFLDRFFAHAKDWMSGILQESKKFSEGKGVRYPHMVFTGGSVMMDGFLEWMQKEFGIEGRIGVSRQIEAPQEIIRDPSLAPVTGMLRWIMTAKQENEALFTSRSFMARMIAAVRAWLTNYL
ncbi:MAG TPA: hypothetical protein PLX96_01105 [Candidatus Omnitrophota bacterium]|nr:hypothetical protein [Candidatus Omnitrophota bacterium]